MNPLPDYATEMVKLSYVPHAHVLPQIRSEEALRTIVRGRWYDKHGNKRSLQWASWGVCTMRLPKV